MLNSQYLLNTSYVSTTYSDFYIYIYTYTYTYIFIIIIHVIYSINSHHDPCEEGVSCFCYLLFPASISPTVVEASARWPTFWGYQEYPEDKIYEVACQTQKDEG